MSTTKPTQKSLKAKIRLMIDTNKLDNDFLTMLFQTHPRVREKCRGRAIAYWRISDDNRGIAVVFTDETSETVSWNKMVQSYCKGTSFAHTKAKQHDVIKAFRREVAQQISDYRFEHGHGMDPAEWHVGHDYNTAHRFVELVKMFLTTSDKQLSDIKIVKQYARQHHFADRALARAWQEFHKTHAVLRMEPAKENLRGNTGFKKTRWTC